MKNETYNSIKKAFLGLKYAHKNQDITALNYYANILEHYNNNLKSFDKIKEIVLHDIGGL
jgi:hypothetical protein